jgi:putative intracellular protease/amidase
MRSFLPVTLLALFGSTVGCAAPSEEAEDTSGQLGQSQCSVLVVLADDATIATVGNTPVTRDQVKVREFGYLLDETAIPVRALLNAGCKVSFTTPAGREAPRDEQGDNATFFTDGLPDPGEDPSLWDVAKATKQLAALVVPGREARAELADALSLVASAESPIRGKGPGSFDTPFAFETFVQNGKADTAKLSRFDAVFVPGGYSPMSLWNNARLGSMLRWFHENDRLTVTLCRGGVALRSTAEGGEFAYSGYKMTMYSTLEDDVSSTANGILPLFALPFHPNEKVKEAGADVTLRPFRPLVIEDRDLISGANQFSAHATATRFVGALTARGAIRSTRSSGAAPSR